MFLTIMGSAFAADAASDTKKPTDSKDQVISFILQKAEKYSEKGEQALGKAVDFVMAETPIVVQEFLMWRFWENAIKFGIAMLFVFGFTALGIFIVVKIYEALPFAMFLFGMACGIFLLNLNSGLDALKIKVAPRVYLIEEAANFIKR